MLSSDQISTLEARCHALREQLTAALSDGAEGAETVELDQTRVGRLSRMDAMQAQAMAKASVGRAKRELDAINAALKRLRHPEFGLCAECDEDIGWRRLELNPAVRHCIECAQTAEKC